MGIKIVKWVKGIHEDTLAMLGHQMVGTGPYPSVFLLRVEREKHIRVRPRVLNSISDGDETWQVGKGDLGRHDCKVSLP